MRKSIFTLLLSLIIIHLLLGCRENNDDDDASSFNTNTGLIGTEGGTITTASGAVIVIPPGALDSSTTITITSYDTQSNLPEYTYIMGNFIGGLVLSPDGLNCQKPVTITIPLNDTITSGMEVKLFLYDDGDADNSNYPANYSGWQQTDFTGTVSSDGKSVVAQIDHFSTYVITMGSDGTSLDILGDMVETFGDNGLGVDFANYQTYFESTVEKLGDLHAHDVPTHLRTWIKGDSPTGFIKGELIPTGFGYDCYKVVGIDYILYHNMGLLFENPLRNFKGTKGEIYFCYNYFKDRFLPDGALLNYELFIYVYKDRTPPAINLTAARTTVKKGEQTNITGCLSCGADKMKDQDVYFSVNSLGSINPTQKTTNNNGDATIRFTAGNDEGTAAVTGEYNAHNKDQIEVISDGVNITIKEEPTIENWSFQIVDNYDSTYPNGNISATSRTIINGTFTVDFSTESYGGQTNFTGSASGERTYTKERFEWDFWNPNSDLGHHQLGPRGSATGSCPRASKTQSGSYSVKGWVWDNREKIRIILTMTSDLEHTVHEYYQCSTSEGPYERKYAFYLLGNFFNSGNLPFKEGLTVIREDPTRNRIYSWELKRN